MGDILWPTYDAPGDLAAIEAVPLADRALPGTTYELLSRAACAGRSVSPCPCSRTANGGSTRRSEPTPSC